MPHDTGIFDRMKIAISGAGVAGPTLAYWLLRAGHEPVLIERAPSFRTGGYMIDFWGVGYSVAERMGILEGVRGAGYQLEEVRMVDASGQRVSGFSASVFRKLTGDRFTSLPRGDLAQQIYAAIDGRVEAIFDNSITALHTRDDALHVELERGPARRFDLVIGADGLHSRVRELCFGPERDFEKRLGYHVAAFDLEGYEPRDGMVYVSYAKPGLQVARFAMRGDRTMFLFVFADELIGGEEPADAEARTALLQRVFGGAGWECPAILTAMREHPDIYFDRVSQIRMNAWAKDRVLLIGDAAGCVSLLAGEGTGLAMTEAYVLAGELARSGADYAAAFRQYEARLRPFLEGKQKSAAKFAAAFAPKTRLGLWARNQATKLLSIPTLAEYLIGRDIRDDFELPEYAFPRAHA